MDADLQLIKTATDLVFYRNKQGLVTGEYGNAIITSILTAIQESRDANVSTYEVVTKAGHSFSKGDVLYYNGFDWAKAKSNVVGSLGYFMVSAVDGDDFTIQNTGLITGLGGLVAGSMYYVSQATAGAITATKPATGYANPIFYAIGETKGFVMPFLADIDFANINGIPTEVDETDTDATKNKLVSNALAKGWEEKIDSSEKGAANGVAELDASSKLPTAQLPDAVVGAMIYQGVWNASTNTPTIESGTGEKGYYYVVSAAGTTNIDGVADWEIGDWIVFNGTVWEKIDNSDKVSSVNSMTGAVTLDIDNITPTTTKGDIIVENGSNAVRLAVGADGKVLKANSAASTGLEWADETGGGGSAEKWTELTITTDFDDQPASTSTITMNSDQTGSILPGMALKFKLSGSYYYAICTAITSNLLTIAGAPLTTGDGDLTELYYCNMPDATHTEIIVISGAFADNTSTTLIESDLLLKGGIIWKKSKAYCVQMGIICTTLDSGTVTTQAQLNGKINSADMLSSDLTVNTSIVNSVVNVNTSTYDINFGESIELELAVLASGAAPVHDAINLTVYLTFVTP